MWVTNNGTNGATGLGVDSVTELSASTGALVQVISASSYEFKYPDSVSSDGSHVWVTTSRFNSVTELKASTAALVQVIT